MRYALILVALSILISCEKKNAQDDWDKKNMREFEADDPRVKLAMKAAQDSLELYVDYFKSYSADSTYAFYVKSSFTNEEMVEHMWSTPFEVTSNGFNCILDNAPRQLKNYSLGDTVKILFRNVEDFIIYSADSTILGNYLQRELDGQLD